MVHCFSPDSTEHWTRYICVLSHTSQSHFLKNPTTVTLQLVKNWRLLCTSATFNWPHFVVFTGHYLRSTCSNLSRAIPEDSAAHLRDHGSGRPACSCRGVHGPSCESNDVGVKLPIKSTTHGVCRACKSNLEGPHQTDPAVVYIYSCDANRKPLKKSVRKSAHPYSTRLSNKNKVTSHNCTVWRSIYLRLSHSSAVVFTKKRSCSWPIPLQASLLGWLQREG